MFHVSGCPAGSAARFGSSDTALTIGALTALPGPTARNRLPLSITVFRDNPRLRPMAAQVCPLARISRIVVSACGVHSLAVGMITSLSEKLRVSIYNNFCQQY